MGRVLELSGLVARQRHSSHSPPFTSSSCPYPALSALIHTRTQLPVPELVPFRLTRQLQGLLLPHAPADALHPALAALLEAAARARRVLEAAMAVFLAEPVVEWQSEAHLVDGLARQQRQRRGAGAGAGDGSSAEGVAAAGGGHLAAKLEAAARRVAGESPAGVIIDGARPAVAGRFPRCWSAVEAAVRGVRCVRRSELRRVHRPWRQGGGWLGLV